MSQKDYKKLVDAKSKIKENSTCIDCGTINPTWVSIKYGVFFCLKCAGIHRSLGVSLDFVMSVSLNSWDKKSYLPVEYGGNQSFKEYLQEKNLDHLTTEARYKNGSVIEYSENLMKKIFDETGVKLECAVKKEYNKKTRPVFEDDPNNYNQYNSTNEKSSSVYGGGSQFASSLSNLKSFIGGSVKSLSEKTMEYGSAIGSKVKSLSASLFEKNGNLSKKSEKDASERYKKSAVRGDRNVSFNKKDWS